jgi:hypothetical protein
MIGAGDHEYSQAVAGAVGQRMRAAQVRAVLGTGAFPYLEGPDVFVDVVTSFLQ